MKKVKKILVYTLIALMPATVQAQNLDTDDVTGKTYICYLYSRLDFVDSRLAFSEGNTVSLSRFNASGFYVSTGGLFIAECLSLNMGYSEIFGDFLFLLTGFSTDSLIVGSGTIIANYEEVYPFIFTGFAVDPAGG